MGLTDCLWAQAAEGDCQSKLADRKVELADAERALAAANEQMEQLLLLPSAAVASSKQRGSSTARRGTKRPASDKQGDCKMSPTETQRQRPRRDPALPPRGILQGRK